MAVKALSKLIMMNESSKQSAVGMIEPGCERPAQNMYAQQLGNHAEGKYRDPTARERRFMMLTSLFCLFLSPPLLVA
ncbi:MAG: hypothetical protein WBW69_19865 [Candidatus Korobacteraceae bacterium]